MPRYCTPAEEAIWLQTVVFCATERIIPWIRAENVKMGQWISVFASPNALATPIARQLSNIGQNIYDTAKYR